MSKSTKPITTFQKTIDRSKELIVLHGTGPALRETDDLLRAACVLAVAGFDRYFTSKFCDVLVPHLKEDKKISEQVYALLSDAGLDTKFALHLAVSDRPFRKIRTIVQNSLSKHTTQRAEVIEELFLHFGLKDICACGEKKAKRKTLVKRTMKLVDIRNDIAHEAHNNTRGDPKAISASDIGGRIDDMVVFVENCNSIIDNRFGVKEPVSA